jgi:hypothetical protein
LTQRIDEVADRTFVHACDAGQSIVSAGQSQHRGQRPESGTRIAQKELARADREASGDPADAPAVAGPRLDTDAEGSERVEHARRIVG